MKRDGDRLVFDDGASFYANCGVLGVGEEFDGKNVGISGGYDESIYREDVFTPAQRRELAEYAIGLWQRWLKEEKVGT